MVPLAKIFEELGAKVSWDQKTSSVTAIKDNSIIVLKIGSKTAVVGS